MVVYLAIGAYVVHPEGNKNRSLTTHQANSKYLSFFIVPADDLLAVEHVIAVMENNRRFWVVAVLAQKKSALIRTIAVEELFMFYDVGDA